MTVYLVGAGPGDPELVTVKAARLLDTADVVVHDRLAAPLLCWASPCAELVDVGKATGSAPVPQAAINELLVERGRRHRCVVRLKGGDPFVLARGAEEAAAVAAAGIDVEIVPGISSALAAPAVAGVPLTLRGVAQSFTVLSGHEDPAAMADGRLEAIAAVGGTIVVLMGAARIGPLASHLIGAGLAPWTPVAAVHGAGTPDETVAFSSLAEVGREVHRPPTTFLIGETVRWRTPTGGRSVAQPVDVSNLSERRRAIVCT